ncbi:hypothetical protein SDC9_138377 [bioreactor metagenome]|uniref:Uncharacterized protein n=1 Tax=bioreactor metagenome TaxID=1076179 RepID=A0A645DP50_9ZZZZ
MFVLRLHTGFVKRISAERIGVTCLDPEIISFFLVGQPDNHDANGVRNANLTHGAQPVLPIYDRVAVRTALGQQKYADARRVEVVSDTLDARIV